MTIKVPSELEPFVKSEVARGHFQSEEEVVREALRLMQERERRLAELRDDIEAGIHSGDAVPGEKVFAELEQKAEELAHQPPASSE